MHSHSIRALEDAMNVVLTYNYNVPIVIIGFLLRIKPLILKIAWKEVAKKEN